jgi:hypothetical protein
MNYLTPTTVAINDVNLEQRRLDPRVPPPPSSIPARARVPRGMSRRIDPPRSHFVAPPGRHGRCEFAVQGGHDDLYGLRQSKRISFSTGLKTPALPSLHQPRAFPRKR